MANIDYIHRRICVSYIVYWFIGLTECQQKAYQATHPQRIGAFVPDCNADGSYARVQCWSSAGYCWCVSEDGTEWPGTRVRGTPNCDVRQGWLMCWMLNTVQSEAVWFSNSLMISLKISPNLSHSVPVQVFNREPIYLHIKIYLSCIHSGGMGVV